MKKPALLAGLLAVPVIFSSTVSAINSFKLGDVEITPSFIATESDENGQVLAATTEEPTDETSTAQANKTDQATTEQSANQNVYVTVEKGDSLSKIASAHGTTWRRLFDANEFIADPDVINPGDKIRIPAANEELASRETPVKPKAKPAATTTKIKRSTSQRVASTPAPAVASGSVWDRLAQCESGGNWHINTGNGYYGGLQFLPSTWRAVGGTGLPHEHSREEQILRAEILLSRSGWGQWPACAKKLGLL